MAILEEALFGPRHRISIWSAVQPCIMVKSSHLPLFVKRPSGLTKCFVTLSPFLALSPCTVRFGQMKSFDALYTRMLDLVTHLTYTVCRRSLLVYRWFVGPASSQ